MKITSTDIKNSFGKFLRLCANEPVYVTKNGAIIAKLSKYTAEEEDYFTASMSEETAQVYNSHRVKMSYEEFLRLNEESTNRYEYIDGEVYLLAAPTVFHQWVISRLHVHLDSYLKGYLKGKACDVFSSPFDVYLKKPSGLYRNHVVQPDLLVICNWRKDVDERGKYRGTPKLVVEVLPPGNSSKEMFNKLNLYRESGIEEYWIIDSESGSALVYHFADGQIAKTRCYSGDMVIESVLYPGLNFKVLVEDE